MAKIQIKSEKLTPFGGFFSICKLLPKSEYFSHVAVISTGMYRYYYTDASLKYLTQKAFCVPAIKSSKINPASTPPPSVVVISSTDNSANV